MPLTIATLPLTPAQTRAARSINAIMALTPRLKLAGWGFELGKRISPVADRAAGRVSAKSLKRRGITVSQTTIGSGPQPVPLRILEPEGAPKALVVDFHGGGWVLGSAALNDPLTGHLAQAGFAVASVDYRLLDEAKQVWISDAVADCVTALRWALSEGQTRFGVETVIAIGESAGAHLLALAMLHLRDEGVDVLPPCVFVQGVFDLSGTPSVRAADPRTLLFDGPNLVRDLGRLTPGLDEAGRRDPSLSPLYARLAGLPPALFVMGQEDPLRDDSRLMAERWAGSAPTTVLEVPTAPHGFQHFGSLTAGLAQACIRRWMAELLPESQTEPLPVQNPTS